MTGDAAVVATANWHTIKHRVLYDYGKDGSDELMTLDDAYRRLRDALTSETIMARRGGEKEPIPATYWIRSKLRGEEAYILSADVRGLGLATSPNHARPQRQSKPRADSGMWDVWDTLAWIVSKGVAPDREVNEYGDAVEANLPELNAAVEAGTITPFGRLADGPMQEGGQLWTPIPASHVNELRGIDLNGFLHPAGPLWWGRASDPGPCYSHVQFRVADVKRHWPTAEAGFVEPIPTILSNTRGPGPNKRNGVVAAMMTDYSGKQIELANAMQKTLAGRYGVSRDTAVKARNEVLRKLQHNSGTTPTNDK